MEFERKLRGTVEESKELFDNFNVRLCEQVKDGEFKVILRVAQNFKIPKVKTIEEMKKSLLEQGELYKRNFESEQLNIFSKGIL